MTRQRCVRSLPRQRGIAAMMTMIFLLVVIGFAAVTLLRMSATDMTDSTAQGDAVAALFLAESGVERASYRLANGTACGNALVDALPVTLGRGSFQTTILPTAIAGGRCRVTVTGLVNATKRTLQVDLNFSTAWLSNNITNNTSNSLAVHTWLHNVPATGSNRILIVGIAVRNNAGQVVQPNPIGVTYGPGVGVPMTRIAAAVPNGTNVSVELWQLVNPPTGGNYPVRVTLSAAAKVVGGSMAFAGVDQTNPVESFGPAINATGTGAAVSGPAVTASFNAMVVDTLAVQAASVANRGGGQSAGWSRQTVGGPPFPNPNVRGAGSWRGPISAPGLVAMTWNVTAGQAWAYRYSVLKAAPVSVAVWSER